jgi:hypothetical protein
MDSGEPKHRPEERGEIQFNVGTIDEFLQACRIAERDNVRRGRIVIDASRYVFLPFSRLKHPAMRRILLGREPEGLNVRILSEHLTGMLTSLLDGKRLPENVCAELLENHLESPLRIWCERAISFSRIVRLESAQEAVLQRTTDALGKREGLAYALSAPFLWTRWLLNRINLVMLKFQIDFAVFLVGFFVTRRRNLVEIAWEIDGDRLVIEVTNNAKIPRYLASTAAERAELARLSIEQPAKMGEVHMGIQRENRPLSRHSLSGSGLGVFMCASIALRFGGELTPPRYDPERRKTAAVFTADIEKLP